MKKTVCQPLVGASLEDCLSTSCGLTAVDVERTTVQCTSQTDPSLMEKRGEPTKDSRILLGKLAGTKAESYTANDKTSNY